MRDAAGISGILGFIVFPSLLFFWMLVDSVRSLLGRIRLGKALAVIRQAREKLYIDGDTTNAEFLISTLPGLVAVPWMPRPISTMTHRFAQATRFALHSESHRRDLSTDTGYLNNVISLFDHFYSALDRGNPLAMAEVTGQMLVLDEVDKRPPSLETRRENVSEDILQNADKPLFLVGIRLEAAAQALEFQDAGQAKEVIEDALEHFPVVVSDEQLAILLLVLHWAQSHLHYVADVRPAGSPLIWKSPEDVVVNLLRKAALAAKRGDSRQLIDVIARSRDAYRTPRI